MIKIRVAQIRKYDVANGKGIRETIFFSGCTHKCKGCFNKEYQDFNYGYEWSKEVEDEVIEHLKNSNISGLSILGGEPFQQNPNLLFNLVRRAKEETGKNIWLWTGYTFDNIPKQYKHLLQFIDIIVDGQFIEELKDIRLKWRGSSNQRIIDVQQTLDKKEIIEKFDLY